MSRLAALLTGLGCLTASTAAAPAPAQAPPEQACSRCCEPAW